MNGSNRGSKGGGSGRRPGARGPGGERSGNRGGGRGGGGYSGSRPGGTRGGQKRSGPERPARQFGGGTARGIVTRRIAAQVKRYPDLDISRLETEGLDARDAALAHAINDICMSRLLTLSYLLARSAQREWIEIEPRVQAAMLVGGAQLVFLDRVPPHAAINESVEWAKRTVRAGAGGIVNATLRRLAELVDAGGESEKRERWTDGRDEVPLEDGRALGLIADVMPVDPVERLSVATSHPEHLLRSWMRLMSLREVRELALHGIARPPTILNTAHFQGDIAELSRDDVELTAHQAPGHHVFRGPHGRLIELLKSRDDVWAQDPASSLAVMSVSDLSPMVVMDICAGKGTKTRQLAKTFPEAQIIATDIDAPRLKMLGEAFAGESRVRVIPYADRNEWAAKVDLVLIDAPCSNTGVLARRPEARYRVSLERTADLARIQRQLIADCIPLLTPEASRRGGIVYSTCSLDPAENEEHIDWAVRWHGLRSSRVERRLPSGGPGEPSERYTDGSFAALIA